MEIPYTQLSEELLRAVIEEFITREGTDYGDAEYSLDDKVKQVENQLIKREIVLSYDVETESCQLISIEEFQRHSPDDSK